MTVMFKKGGNLKKIGGKKSLKRNNRRKRLNKSRRNRSKKMRGGACGSCGFGAVPSSLSSMISK